MNKENKLEHIIKRYRENKMAHAYLIETNNQDACLKDLLEVVKIISCNGEYKSDCSECNLCNLIKLNNLPTLKIIEPDGSFIKKGQIQELKEVFSTKPIYSKYNIYIIKNAEKLNASSANTMLKFLEEPDGQVIGFFLTNNKDNIILTIQSRCQLIKAEYDVNMELEFSEDIYCEILPTIKDYLLDIEEGKSTAILKNKKIVLEAILKVITLEEFFKLLLDIYRNALYYKRDILNSFTKFSDFEFILNNNEDVLIKKINLLVEFVENLNYNLNSELMLDRFVLEMGGINE